MLMPFEVTVEAGYTSSLADVLRSMGNPPVRILTDEDVEKEEKFAADHPVENDSLCLNPILPHAERMCYMISGIIRINRAAKGLSESELARRSGHAVSTIHGIENGDNKNPGFKLIGDIAKVLNISLDELYQVTLGKGKG